MQQSWRARACTVCSALVWGLFGLAVLWLWGLGLTGRCAVTPAETLEYGPAPLAGQLAVCTLALALAWAARRPSRLARGFCRAVQSPVPGMAVLGAATAALAAWALAAPSELVDDQLQAMDCARALLAGSNAPWQPGGYAEMNPNQNGLILVFAAALRLFGGRAVAALQLANLACWALGVYSLWRLYRLLYGGAHSLVLAACALFLPLGFYVTFIYGTLPGFGLSSFALWQQCAWLRDRAAWRLPPLALAAVAACLIKQNYLIALVGLGLVFAAHALLRDARSLAALALLALVWLGGSRALALGVYRLTGLPQSEGVPPEAYVAMGLQETPPAGPGWFNYYNWQLYAWYGGDAGLAAAHARQDIAAALAAWRQAPAQAAGFMVRKVRSQWCEPTFQSLWIQQRKRDASPDEAVPRLVDALLRPGSGLGRAYYGVFGLAQSAVLLGAALCAARELRRGRVCALALPAVFLGGFLFHLAWEAKGQYTVPYFILLVPLAAAGYAWAGGALARRLPRGSR